MPEPSYRASPSVLLALLLGGALVLALAGGGLAYAGWPRREAEPEPEPIVVPEFSLTPLEQALELLENAARAERRRRPAPLARARRRGARRARRRRRPGARGARARVVADAAAARGDEGARGAGARDARGGAAPRSRPSAGRRKPRPPPRRPLRRRPVLGGRARSGRSRAATRARCAVRPCGPPCSAGASRPQRSRCSRPPSRRRATSIRATAACSRTGTGVVVVDLSLSIVDDTSGARPRSAAALRSTADAPVGLVIFSDVPYELLPPGTPPSELRPLIRMLTPIDAGGVVTRGRTSSASGTRSRRHAARAGDARGRQRQERLDPPDQRPRDRARRRACDWRACCASIKQRGHAGAPRRPRAVERQPAALRRDPRPRTRSTPSSSGPNESGGAASAGAAPLPARLLVLGALFLVALAAARALRRAASRSRARTAASGEGGMRSRVAAAGAPAGALAWSLVAAAFLALLALDVGRWRARSPPDDVRYRAFPADDGCGALPPSHPSTARSGCSGSRTTSRSGTRSAHAADRRARRSDRVRSAARDPAHRRERAARVGRAPRPVTRSGARAAANLLGVLEHRRLQLPGAPRAAALTDRSELLLNAIASFRQAIELDPDERGREVQPRGAPPARRRGSSRPRPGRAQTPRRAAAARAAPAPGEPGSGY